MMQARENALNEQKENERELGEKKNGACQTQDHKNW